MTEPAREKAVYDDLYDIPENMIGEIIDGELVVSPRPSRKHGYAASMLSGAIVPPYNMGRGGPGGWIFINEPEISFGDNIIVPDLAGWKRERFPETEEHNWIEVIPDWVCEVISPSSARIDRIRKMRIYSQYKVLYIWLIEPVQMTLEVYKLESGKWAMLEAYAENDKVRAEPFQNIEIDLGILWLVNMLAPKKEGR